MRDLLNDEGISKIRGWIRALDAREVEHGGYINFGKRIELILNNGFDPVSGERIGLETGAPRSLKFFDDFSRAVLDQTTLAIRL